MNKSSGETMCKCRDQIDKELEPSNARLAAGFMWHNRKVDLTPPMISLEKIDKGKRKPLPVLLATYCPFCGVKQDSGQAGGALDNG